MSSQKNFLLIMGLILTIFVVGLSLLSLPYSSDSPLASLKNADSFTASPTWAGSLSAPVNQAVVQADIDLNTAASIGQEAIIQFSATADQTEIDAILETLKAERVQDLSYTNGSVVLLNEAISDEQIQAISSIVVIEPNYRVQSLVAYPPNDPLLNQQWSFEALKTANLWQSIPDDGADVTIAVIDSGVCASHPDLQGQILSHGYDFIDDDNKPDDLYGHGCAVSGIIAANINNGIGIAGLVPNVKIMPIRVLDAKGIGTYADVASAIHYAVDNGASIINLSLGGQNPSQILQEAVNYAAQHNVKIVAGAGNTGKSGVFYPAAYPEVIAVGSSDRNGNQSSFSSYGLEVDTLAPGENILTTTLNGGYGLFSGTSMAVPHVSALLALSQQSGKTLDLANIVSTPSPQQADGNYAYALAGTATITPTRVPSTPTPSGSQFQCADIQLTNVSFSGSHIFFTVQNNGGISTALKSIEIYYPSIDDFPDFRLAYLSFQSEVFWVGYGDETSPVYVDQNSLSYDDTDLWSPVNKQIAGGGTSKTVSAHFVAGPQFIYNYVTIPQLAGTKLTFINPFNASSPCIFEVGMEPQCGTTQIRFEAMTEDTMSFLVDDVPVAGDVIQSIYQQPEFSSQWYPVSGTLKLNQVDIDNHVVWTGTQDLPVDTSTDGVWNPYSEIDGNRIVFHYDTNFALNEYLDAADWFTYFDLINTNDDSTCNEPPLDRINVDAIPKINSHPYANGAVTLNWSYGETATDYIIEGQAQGETWEILAQVSTSIGTSFIDSDVQCEVYTRWRVTAYDANTNEYSQPSLAVTAFPSCPNILPPTFVTVTPKLDGLQLTWSIQNSSHSGIYITRLISGVDSDYQPLAIIPGKLVASYLDTTAPLCNQEIKYNIGTYFTNGGSPLYSNSTYKPFFQLCADIELEVTAETLNPEAFDFTDLTFTVHNQGPHTANTLMIDINVPSNVAEVTTSNGTYDPVTGVWIVNNLQALTSETLTMTVFTVVDNSGDAIPVVAQLINSSSFDFDSVPNNGVNSEDDYASLTLTTICQPSDVFDITAGDTFGLIAAIGSANSENCFPGQDIISLPQDSTFIATKRYDGDISNNNNQHYLAFPPISSDIVIQGNGALIKKESENALHALRVTELGSLDLDDVTISSFGGNNSGAVAIWGRGSLIIRNSTFEYNETISTASTIISASGPTSILIEGSLFHHNRGGVAVYPYGSVVRNNTFSENIASNALRIEDEATVSFNTFYMNSANALWLNQPDAVVHQIHLLGNILYNPNRSQNCINFSFNNLVDSLGYNVSSSPESDCMLYASTNDIIAEPDIFPDTLKDNGGLTLSHALLEGSAAIDIIPPEICDVNTDQRGFPRPFGTNCDAGSIEQVDIPLETPINLLGTVVDYQNVDLTWQDNATYKTAYVIERSLDGTIWTEIATLPADSESYSDTDLACFTSYYYQVSRLIGNIRATSETISLATDCPPLTAPSDLQATSLDSTLIELEWQDHDTRESGFNILRQISGSSWENISTIAANNTQFIDNTVTCETDYNYQVQAFRLGDSSTADSNIIAVTSDVCPLDPPTSFVASNSAETSLDLTWVDQTHLESAYIISRSSDGINYVVIDTLAADAQSYSDTNLACETMYGYQLQAYRAAFDIYSIVAETSATTTACTVQAPDNLTSSNITRNGTTITWQDSSPQETTHIVIERALESAGASALSSGDLDWQTIATIVSSSSSYNDSDLQCDAIYWYRVRGFDEVYQEYSEHSEAIQVITLPCPIAVTNTIGLYQNGLWMFRDSFDDSGAIFSFFFGPREAGWMPITGDWDGDGVDGIGLYKNGIFLLRDITDKGAVDYVLHFGKSETGWMPIVGDWNGDDKDTIGLYKNATFILSDSLENPKVDYQFNLGKGDAGWMPIAGDWTGVGSDRVGLYKNGMFALHNSFKTQLSPSVFIFGPIDGTWMPIAGDWNQDNVSTIGVYRDRIWRLKNSNAGIKVDIGFNFGNFTGKAYPLASYRGDGEALEALTFFSAKNIDWTSTDVITIQPTIVLIPTATISETFIEIPVSISGASPSETPTMIPPTAMEEVFTATPELTSSPLIPTETSEPTMDAMTIEPEATDAVSP